MPALNMEEDVLLVNDVEIEGSSPSGGVVSVWTLNRPEKLNALNEKTASLKINDEQNDLLVRILRDIHTNWGDLELGDYGHTNVPGVVKAHMFGAVGYDSGVRENTKQLFMALGFTEDDYKVLRSLARKGGPIMSLSYDDFCFHMDIDLSVWKNVVFPQYVNVEKIANKCTLPIRDRQQDEQKAINRIVHKKDDFFGAPGPRDRLFQNSSAATQDRRPRARNLVKKATGCLT